MENCSSFIVFTFTLLFTKLWLLSRPHSIYKRNNLVFYFFSVLIPKLPVFCLCFIRLFVRYFFGDLDLFRSTSQFARSTIRMPSYWYVSCFVLAMIILGQASLICRSGST